MIATAARPTSKDQQTAQAGLVLVHLHLPDLLRQLGAILPSDGPPLPTGIPRARAALAYLSGSRPDAPDPLADLLLGIPPGAPWQTADLTPNDTARIDSLADTITGQWVPLRNNTRDALRQTFLRRPGRLSIGQTAANLVVARGPFDMLLDQLPWSYNPVRLPWMRAPCIVDWKR